MSNQSQGSANSSEKSEQWALAWVLAINTAQAAIVGGLGWWRRGGAAATATTATIPAAALVRIGAWPSGAQNVFLSMQL